METDIRANGAPGTTGQTPASSMAEAASLERLPTSVADQLREIIHQLELAQAGKSEAGAPPDVYDRLQAIVRQFAEASTPPAARPVYTGPGEPRVRPWEAREEQHSELPELAVAASLRAELLQRTNGRPWTASSELLAADEGR